MNKFLVLALVGLMSAPAFAVLSTSAQQDQVNDFSLPGGPRGPGHGGPGDHGPGRGPGPGHGGPGDHGPGRGRPFPPSRPLPPPRRPLPPPRQHVWTCEARNARGFTFRATDWNQNQARNEARRACERQSRVCFDRGCY